MKTYYKIEEDKETPQSILAMEYHEHLVSYVSGNSTFGSMPYKPHGTRKYKLKLNFLKSKIQSFSN